ncbi:MAG: hypothetical protein EP317_00025 [Bacillota bacterium]|nr:MAG: hypothetical protein EP317_00025 [Bacillota bacterium]
MCPKCGEETGSKVVLYREKMWNGTKKIARFIKKAFLYLLDRAIFYAKKAWPHIKKFFSVRRNVYITAGVLAGFILIFVILGLLKDPSVEPPLLDLGDPVAELEQNVPSTGAVLSVDELSSPIFGFEMVVPFGAYDELTPFEITTQTIESHDLGDTFTPITPLINIDNGHTFSNEPLTLTIPVEIEEGEFAMGFYYDVETNRLEGIPMKNLTSTEITLYTNHFSSIVVSKISIDELLKLTNVTNQYVDTGFMPGVDDWQFTNYGSFLAPGGHCAGQVLTMSWYYHTQKIGEGEPALYNRFDNVGFEATEAFMEDDNLGYRFASVIQNLLDFSSEDFYDYLSFAGDDKQLIYFAFSYAMVVTNKPQLMAIYARNESGDIISGHAIMAYKMQGYDIYVADPNYPGQTNRKVHFNTSPGVYEFDPYSSGANAQAILDEGALLYDDIFYIGESALIDYERIEEEYNKLLEGTIGDEYFPTLEASFLSEYDQNVDDQVWMDVQGDEITLGTAHNDVMACYLQNKVVIGVTANHLDAVYTLYQGDQYIEGPYYASEDGYIYYEVELINGVNEIGVLAEIVVGSDRYYADFMRIKINYTAGVTTECAATIVGRYNFYSRSDGQNLVQNHYILIREDGTFTESYTVNNPLYTNVIDGTWTIVPGQNAGENILYLTFGGTTDTYEVLDNYQRLRYTAGDIIFLFQKES